MTLPVYFDLAMFVPSSLLTYAQCVYDDKVDSLAYTSKDIAVQLDFEELGVLTVIHYVSSVIKLVHNGKSLSGFTRNAYIDTEVIKQEISSMDNIENYLNNANAALEVRSNILRLSLLGE